jgi:hypothetical protein
LQVRHRAAVGPTLLGLAQVHVPNAIDRNPRQSRHSSQSVYLGVLREPARQPSQNQRLTTRPQGHVPRNCQSRGAECLRPNLAGSAGGWMDSMRSGGANDRSEASNLVARLTGPGCRRVYAISIAMP